MAGDGERQAERYAALVDPQRRAIHRYVREARRPVTREDVAAGTGVSRSLAAFHLERLLEAGLLTADYARPPGRGGPGAGRPAKRYAPSDAEITIEIPPRSYALAGRLLARAIERAGDGGSPHDEALALAAAEGRRLAARARDTRGAGRDAPALEHTLTELGFEPLVDADTIVLANCPFHALADVAPQLVCGMNAALLEGLVRGLGRDDLDPRLEPADGRCCVVIARDGGVKRGEVGQTHDGTATEPTSTCEEA